MFAQLQGRYL